MPSTLRQQSYLPRHESNSRPPRYSTLSVATLPLYPAAGELDISRQLSRAEPVERQAFDFCLEDKGPSAHGHERRAWATLRLFSSVPSTLQRPRYTGGDNIEGIVMLNSKRAQTIVSVSVVLRGQIVTSSRPDGAHTFLEVATPIWDNSPGVAMHSNEPVNGKLQGLYAWPFSIPFPTEFGDPFSLPGGKRKVRDRSHEAPKTYTTPQTLRQKGINANIQYEVRLKVTTSGLFNSRHRVSAPILYVPLICAPPLPPLRASAYASGASLISPEDDPTGWQQLKEFRVRVASKGIECIIECTGYIAKPTTYTRGNVIPCYLVCKASNTDDHSSALLRSFVDQRCVSFELSQRVQYHHDPWIATTSGSVNEKAGQGRRIDCAAHSEEGGTAVWWTPGRPQSAGQDEKDSPRSKTELTLEGEVHIDVALLPTCKVPFLEVSHDLCISLKPSKTLEVNIIDPKGNLLPHSKDALPSFPVAIVTAHAPGCPAPTSYTPPPPKKAKDRSVVHDAPTNWFGPGVEVVSIY